MSGAISASNLTARASRWRQAAAWAASRDGIVDDALGAGSGVSMTSGRSSNSIVVSEGLGGSVGLADDVIRKSSNTVDVDDDAAEVVDGEGFDRTGFDGGDDDDVDENKGADETKVNDSAETLSMSFSSGDGADDGAGDGNGCAARSASAAKTMMMVVRLTNARSGRILRSDVSEKDDGEEVDDDDDDDAEGDDDDVAGRGASGTGLFRGS